MLSVFTKEWLEADVAIVDGVVAGLGDENAPEEAGYPHPRRAARSVGDRGRRDDDLAMETDRRRRS